jgi:Flp pilus assembly protein TadD
VPNPSWSLHFHRPRVVLSTLTVMSLLSSVPTLGQTPDGSVPDAIVQQYRESIVLSADGTETHDVTTIVKINTERGVQERGTLTIPYERDTGTLEMRYVRVRKADGSVVDTPVDTAIDQPSDITREAPAFTDLYERHVNVRGLRVGDTIEFAYHRVQRPMFSGHVADEDEWLIGEAVEDGEITLSTPASIPLVVKTHGTQPVVTMDGGRRVYRWTVSHPSAWTVKDLAALVRERKTRRPAVEITTFRTWDEVGDAIRALWRGRADVTPEVRAKAEALTKERQTEAEKIAAIYDFVANDVRYVEIAFGIGRYQPHTANEVLNYGFGDCKDKHVLLEAMLRAIGVDAAPVLVAPGESIDADVPSPVQFTHVVTLAQTTNGPLWMDATLPHATPGYLLPQERHRDGLRVPASASASVVRTIADPLQPTVSKFVSHATLAPDGTLTAHVEETYSGDLAYIVRLVWSNVPKDREDEAARAMLKAAGMTGEMSELTTAELEDPNKPVRMMYTLTTKNYWASGVAALLPMTLDLPEAIAGEPIDLETAVRTESTSTIELPAGYDASFVNQPPLDKSDNRDFGSYTYHFSLDGTRFVATRSFEASGVEVPADRTAEYTAFRTTTTAPLPVLTLRESWPWTSVSAPRFENRAGTIPAATQFVAQAARSSPPLAVALLQKAVEIEPNHPSAWSLLGEQLMYIGRTADGEAALRKALAIAPSADGYKRMGVALAGQQRWAAAEQAFRDGIAKYPADRDMPALLGETLLNAGQPGEAAVVLQAEAARRPRSSRLQSALGRAWLRSGQVDKGVAALHESVRLEAGPNIWAIAASELADAGRDLDTAQRYAEQAVQRTITENATAEFAKLPPYAGNAAVRLAFYFEALGRVLAKRHDDDRAQEYCRASWELAFRWRAAQCLGDIAVARKDAASVDRYRAFIRNVPRSYMPAGIFDAGPGIKPTIPTPPAEAKANYDAFMARDKLQTFDLTRPSGARGSGRVELLTGADGRVREVRMSQAPREFEPMVTQLLNLKIGPVLPENAQAVLLRYGLINCPDPAAPKPVVTTTVRGTSGEVPESVQRAEQLRAETQAIAASGCRLTVQ